MQENEDYDYEYESQFRKALTSLPDEYRHQVVAMKKVLIKRLKIENEYKKKYQEIKAKYDTQFQNNFLKRNAIISGDEVPDPSDPLFKNHPIPTSPSQEKGIPLYWFKCLQNSTQFKNKINDKDSKILQNLKSIRCVNTEKNNFKILFIFQEKDVKTFFTNPQLEIEYVHDKSLNIKEIKSPGVNWTNDNVNPTIEIKKEKNKKTGEIRVVKKPVTSFFNIFTNLQMNKDKNSDLFDEASDLGSHLKEDLIPNSVEYYLNMMNDFDFDEADDDFDEDDF